MSAPDRSWGAPTQETTNVLFAARVTALAKSLCTTIMTDVRHALLKKHQRPTKENEDDTTNAVLDPNAVVFGVRNYDLIPLRLVSSVRRRHNRVSSIPAVGLEMFWPTDPGIIQ